MFCFYKADDHLVHRVSIFSDVLQLVLSLNLSIQYQAIFLGGVTLGNILTDDWQSIWEREECRTIREKSARMERICQLHTGNKEAER